MLRPAVEEVGKELLGIEFISAGQHSVLRLFIDHENGIDVDDCAEVSRQVGALLDVEDPISTKYNLEVSSPGLDRPLFTLEHYKQFVGEIIKIKLFERYSGRKNFIGVLNVVHDEEVEIGCEEEKYSVPFRLIERARLVPQF
jgi:ribosome maturation factor RimP